MKVRWILAACIAAAARAMTQGRSIHLSGGPFKLPTGLDVMHVPHKGAGPELPALIEPGYPGFVVTAWLRVLAPAKTPGVIVNRLNAGIVRAYTQPHVRERLHGLAATASNMSPVQFGDFIRAETGSRRGW